MENQAPVAASELLDALRLAAELIRAMQPNPHNSDWTRVQAVLARAKTGVPAAPVKLVKSIQVEIKNVYGNELVYPVCQTAKLLADLTGHKTLTYAALGVIKALGYTVEVVTTKPRTL